MKKQKKSLYSLPVFKGRAVLGGLPPRMDKVYFGEAMVEQLKQKGINVHEIGIRKENPLEDVDKIPVDEYLDVMQYIMIECLLWQAKHIMEKSNREGIHKEEEE